jgi:hypothetical protein
MNGTTTSACFCDATYRGSMTIFLIYPTFAMGQQRTDANLYASVYAFDVLQIVHFSYTS